jgi:hypothetical protein
LNAQNVLCSARIYHGECVLLFTSSAAVAAFADSSGVKAGVTLVFSRSRSEFLTQADRSFGQGFIGGLIDLTAVSGHTAFVGFDVDRRQGGPQAF